MLSCQVWKSVAETSSTPGGAEDSCCSFFRGPEMLVLIGLHSSLDLRF